MNPTTVIPTDLVTPLGAYLRLREHGQAAFLLWISWATIRFAMSSVTGVPRKMIRSLSRRE